MYDKQYFLHVLTSLLRALLAGVGTLFVQKGIGSQGEWDFLVAGIALLLINLVSILYAKYQNRLHFLAALNSRPGTPEETVRAEAKDRAAV
jgi:hypothetical protein